MAPALLAASAMNGAVYDSTLNVFFKLNYAKLDDSVLATPLGPRDVAVGEVAWALARGQVYAMAFLVVMALAGLVGSWWALLALPAATLIGFAFAAAGMAATTYMRSFVDFDYVQLAVLPLFLFWATFYPVSTYPGPLAWAVQATPLYHGVALVRDLVLGSVHVGLLWHVAYLVVMGLRGLGVAARRLERLLLSRVRHAGVACGASNTCTARLGRVQGRRPPSEAPRSGRPSSTPAPSSTAAARPGPVVGPES